MLVPINFYDALLEDSLEDNSGVVDRIVFQQAQHISALDFRNYFDMRVVEKLEMPTGAPVFHVYTVK